MIWPEWCWWMEDGLLCKIKHFRDVFQVPGRTFDAGLDFLKLVHDRKDRLHRGVVDQIHLKLNKLKMRPLPRIWKGRQTCPISLLTLLPTRMTGVVWFSEPSVRRTKGSQWSVTESKVSSSSTAYTMHTTWARRICKGEKIKEILSIFFVDWKFVKWQYHCKLTLEPFYSA